MLRHIPRLTGPLVVTLIVSGCGGDSSSPKPPPDSAATQASSSTPKPPLDDAATTQAEAAWTYGETKDEMRGTVTKYATKESTNIVNFGFPYGGEQRGTVMISGSSALFYLIKGQIICNGLDVFGTCLVLVKFDDGKATYVTASTVGDKSTTLSFDSAFLAQLQRRKKVAIQVEVYHEGYPIFTFELGGFHQG
jgi:hypothetical protein